MAFRRDRLKAVGGFDARFRTAGDDVDLCWRIQQQGGWLAFDPGAVVLHHRRNSIRTYWRQQKGYGRAEAILERKWPDKYNPLGHLNWTGKIYGRGLTRGIGFRKWRIYHGTWGSAPFQSLYGPGIGFWQSWPILPEWYLINAVLLMFSLTGLIWKPLLLAVPLMAFAMGLSLMAIIKSGATAPLSPSSDRKTYSGKLRASLLTATLHAIQPLARLYGRFRWGLTPWRRRGLARYRLPTPQNYIIWSERWKTCSQWLASIETAIQRQGSVVKRGGDFDDWDVEIRGGYFGTIRGRLAVEEHGAGKQLIRLRVWPKISWFALILTMAFALLALLAIIDGAAAAAVFLMLVAVVLCSRLVGDCAVAKAACREAVQAVSGLSYDPCNNVSTGIGDANTISALGRAKADVVDFKTQTPCACPVADTVKLESLQN